MNAEKLGPNSPCPCGSGKKYKKCCGAGRQAEE
jgi:preprotein translocase subunit SecA